MYVKDQNRYIVTCPSLDSKLTNLLNNLSVLEILTLNLASVIGQSFDDSIIQSINIFSNLPHYDIQSCLKSLARQDLIETIGLINKTKIYRFVTPYLKKLIYKKMLFSQRKEIHKMYAEYLKVNPLPSYT